MNSARWTLLAIGYMCAWAYITAMMVYQFSTWYSTGTFATGQLVSCVFAVAIIALLFRKTPTATEQ